MPLILTLRVAPASGKQKAMLDKNGRLKIYLKSQAERGQANKELMRYLSCKLKISTNDITIIAGETARIKLIKINKDITQQELMTALEIEVQMKLLEG